MTRSHQETIDALLEKHGTTFAQQAGITLTDEPSPLYRLLVLTTLLSTRISADIAVDAARELSSAGLRTPQKMLDASWRQRVTALGRARYKRYDESTATRLGESAQLVLDDYDGDLRRLRDEAGSASAVLKRLQDFPGIGPTGASIFAREVQGIWPSIAPVLDKKALDGAQRLDLPTDPERLAQLVSGDDLPRLAAALVRVALDRSQGDPLG